MVEKISLSIGSIRNLVLTVFTADIYFRFNPMLFNIANCSHSISVDFDLDSGSENKPVTAGLGSCRLRLLVGM